MSPLSNIRTCAIAFVIATASIGAAAAEAVLEIKHPWSRASTGLSRPGVAYLEISNSGTSAVELVGVKTSLAGMTMLHKTETDANGVARMSHADDIVIEPGATVVLEPGGLHVMLMNLKDNLIEGENYPATLVFSDGQEISVDVSVLGVGATGPDTYKHSH
ncbi:MAG: copper chaperone PCu(A)C [Pseudomonadota bacterium]